ncbi:MAG TPA: peptidoglycan-binding domain-containing protein [Gemmatimonadaceae bacterium]|nr:peptidoglycan-binding domain-containing protein [Gemmatimonadaceae bacterium]
MKRMTIAVMALVAIPALASAQNSTRQQIDSARTKMQSQDTATARTTGTARGRRASRSSMGLSSDQVMQLQTALTNAGCDAGTADGVLGPKTRRAMACARQKNSVTTNADLYRSLNLDFETSGRQPSRGAHEASTEVRATHGDSAEVGGRNRGRIRPPATDSTRRDSTRRDSTRRDSTSH